MLAAVHDDAIAVLLDLRNARALSAFVTLGSLRSAVTERVGQLLHAAVERVESRRNGGTRFGRQLLGDDGDVSPVSADTRASTIRANYTIEPCCVGDARQCRKALTHRELARVARKHAVNQSRSESAVAAVSPTCAARNSCTDGSSGRASRRPNNERNGAKKRSLRINDGQTLNLTISRNTAVRETGIRYSSAGVGGSQTKRREATPFCGVRRCAASPRRSMRRNARTELSLPTLRIDRGPNSIVLPGGSRRDLSMPPHVSADSITVTWHFGDDVARSNAHDRPATPPPMTTTDDGGVETVSTKVFRFLFFNFHFFANSETIARRNSATHIVSSGVSNNRQHKA
jgi:hypothetical protein